MVSRVTALIMRGTPIFGGADNRPQTELVTVVLKTIDEKPHNENKTPITQNMFINMRHSSQGERGPGMLQDDDRPD